MKFTKTKVFITGFVFILIIASLLPNIFLPVDILHLFPSFAKTNYSAPKNSLLADPLYQFEPWRFFAKNSLLNDTFPLWNNLNGSGSPFFANPQTAVLFPLNLLYYVFPTRISLFLIPLLKLYLFGLFSYLYLRSIKVSSEISIIGSVVASVSGYFILWLLWPQTNVLLFFPLLLFIVEKVRENKVATHRLYASISIIYCFMIFGGHPETLFHCSIIYICYALLRLFKEKKKFFCLLFSTLIGGLLAGILLIPFIEYLLNSYAFQNRLQTGVYNFLPLQSFISNMFPFILGSPHLPFYKPFSQTSNFQEYTGGYVGTVAFIIAFVGFIKLKKTSIFIFWSLVILASWLIIYGIPPFSLITRAFFIHSIDNNRLISFSAYGTIILFALSLQKLLNKKDFLKYLHKKFLTSLFLSGIAIFFIGILILQISPLHPIIKSHSFILFLIKHIYFIAVSSIGFFLVLIIVTINKNLNTKWILLLIIPLFFQTGLFFWNYNPTVQKKDYFPGTQLTKKMESLPKGNYIDVGNPSIPANINIMYGIGNAQNDDAIQVNSYTKDFNKSFPEINQWKIVDKVKKDQLIKFGISYVLSDYNLNYLRQEVQPNYSTLGNPFIKQTLVIPFVAESDTLREIRILPANYNRPNSCKIDFSIVDMTDEKVFEQILNCKNFLDKMYYTFDVNANLIASRTYKIKISPLNSSVNNSIALWGNTNGIPYISLFYNKGSKDFQFISKENNTQIWKVPDVNTINLKGTLKILNSNNSNLVFLYKSGINQNVVIKRTFYPGWKVYIDGNETKIKNNNLFITFSIPKGEHVVSLKYQPLSFLIGIALSLLTAFFLFTYFLREELKQPTFFNILKFWSIKSKKVNNETVFIKGMVILTSLIVGIVIFLCINFILIPKSLPVPKTTVVNWLIVHKHSLTLDYLRFSLLAVLIPLSIISGWIIFIWKKNR